MSSLGYGPALMAFTRKVSESYSAAQKLLANPANINQSGHITELIWQKFLQDWLPPEYAVLTRRFISGNGAAPLRETDLIVLRPGCGDNYAGKARVEASDVAAAFEVKLTLRDQHVREAAAAAARNARLAMPLSGRSVEAAENVEQREPHVGRAKAEVVGPIVFGLLSHSYGEKQRSPFSHLTSLINESDRAEAKHPRESLDLVCVADMGSWIQYGHFMTPPSTIVPPGFPAPRWHSDQIDTGYFPYKPVEEIPAVAAFLTSLFLHIDVATPDPMIKLIGEELRKLSGSRSTAEIREWPAKNVLTPGALGGAIRVKQSFVIR